MCSYERCIWRMMSGPRRNMGTIRTHVRARAYVGGGAGRVVGHRTEGKMGHLESHDQEATGAMQYFANCSHPFKELET